MRYKVKVYLIIPTFYLIIMNTIWIYREDVYVFNQGYILNIFVFFHWLLRASM